MRTIQAVGTILVASICGSSNAQQAQMCNAAISTGIRDNYSIMTEQEQFELFQRRLCDVKFESHENFNSSAAGLGIDIPVAEAIIGLSGSTESKRSSFREKYSSYCEANYFNAAYRSAFSANVSKVSAVLANTWLECHKMHTAAWLAANQKGIYIDVTPQENFSDFTVTGKRYTPDTGPMVVTDITPAGSFSCHRNGAPFGSGAKVDTNEFTFSCTKPPQKTVTISLDTSKGVSNSVTVPAYSSKIEELSSRITSENRILQDRLAIVEAQLLRIGTASENEKQPQPRIGGNKNGWVAESSCPAGYYVSGVVGQDHDRGDYCYDCMSRFNVICKPVVSRE
ncbi:hypothetical protein [Luteimonas saliphila]|uniref:hypothetical protein n=1 Tax=Luteimonas saliphila TaxID=2804919 RepID=UPI00192DCF4A|nr:hypothetical protein [Luteimonas saliphila]